MTATIRRPTPPGVDPRQGPGDSVVFTTHEGFARRPTSRTAAILRRNRPPPAAWRRGGPWTRKLTGLLANDSGTPCRRRLTPIRTVDETRRAVRPGGTFGFWTLIGEVPKVSPVPADRAESSRAAVPSCLRLADGAGQTAGTLRKAGSHQRSGSTDWRGGPFRC